MVTLGIAVLSGILIGVGIQGLTPRGLPLSKSRTLTGTTSKWVGAVCIVAGLGLVPLFRFVVRTFLR